MLSLLRYLKGTGLLKKADDSYPASIAESNWTQNVKVLSFWSLYFLECAAVSTKIVISPCPVMDWVLN